MRSNLRFAPVKVEPESPTAGRSYPGLICLIVGVVMTVGVLYFWRTPDQPNGGISFFEGETRTSARTPVPQRMLTPKHHFEAFEQTDQQFDEKLLYRGWECKICGMQFVYRDHPVQEQTIQFALKRVDEKTVPEKRWDYRRASTIRLNNMLQKHGAMAALFEIDGLYEFNNVGFFLHQDAQGHVELAPFSVMTPEALKHLRIFDDAAD